MLISHRAAQRSGKAANSTSRYKGVTKHRCTGKFEAHLWDSTHIRVTKVIFCCLSLFSQDVRALI